MARTTTGQQQFDSAPSIRRHLSLIVAPNLLISTLAVTVQVRDALVTPTPVRRDFRVDQAPNLLPLQPQAPLPKVGSLSASAPALTVRAAVADALNLLPAQIAATFPAIQGLTGSAPASTVRATVADAVNRLPLPSAAAPIPLQCCWGAPAVAARLSSPDPVNLLTLQPVATTLPAGVQGSGSAPGTVWRLSVGDPVNRLTLAPAAAVLPPGLAWFASAPAVAGRLTTEPGLNPAILFPAAVNPLTTQLTASAPAAAYVLGRQEPVNLLPLTQTPAVQPAVQGLSASAPAPKGAVTVDQIGAPLTLTPPPIGQQRSETAPQARYQTQVDAFPNALVLAPVVLPATLQQSGSAPPPKYAVQVDAYGNLQASTLAPPPAQPIPLPLGLPVDVSQWQGKYAVQADRYPNTVLLGIPQPPTPAPPSFGSNAPTAGGGGGKRDWPVERPKVQQRAPIPQADLESVQATENPGVPVAPAVSRITADQAVATRLLDALKPAAGPAPDDDDDDEEAIYLLLS